MNPVRRNEIKKNLRKFVGGNYLPKSVYQERCDVEADNCCGGKGKTCAPEDVPDTWHDLIDEFVGEHHYGRSEIVPIVDSISDELEQSVPA